MSRTEQRDSECLGKLPKTPVGGVHQPCGLALQNTDPPILVEKCFLPPYFMAKYCRPPLHSLIIQGKIYETPLIFGIFWRKKHYLLCFNT